MRVLLSAFACRPGHGSEAGVGWNWASRLSKHHDVTVLTGSTSRPYWVEANEPQSTRLAVHFIREWGPQSPWPFGLEWLSYYIWQVRAGRLAARLHAERPFDLVHHVTYASWRVPSFIHRLSVPFIFGPVGGGQQLPRNFYGEMGFAGRLREHIRDLGQRVSVHDPFLRQCLRRATLLLAANQDTMPILQKAGGKRPKLMREQGYEDADISTEIRRAREVGPLRAVWVGRLEPRKALQLLLRALARPGVQDVTLDVIGDGPLRRTWERLAAKLELSERVRFHGSKPRSGVQEAYRKADVFVFTSLRETTGTVVLEAMAEGLPIICLNCTGPGEVTDDQCAVRIHPGDPKQVVDDLAAALRELGKDPGRRERMGQAGLARLRERYGWHAHLQSMLEHYDNAMCSHSGSRPGSRSIS